MLIIIKYVKLKKSKEMCIYILNIYKYMLYFI